MIDFEFFQPALQRQPCDRIIVSPRRQIIIEGQLQILDSGKAQEVFVVLFDDMLLITKRKKGLSKKVCIITAIIIIIIIKVEKY